MKRYVGTKVIDAKPMTRAEYNEYRGWELPADENGADEGYLVEYLDGGKANDSRHAGYISWSPKDVFSRAYQEFHGMTFGMACDFMRKGQRASRANWNGKGMWIEIVPRDYAASPVGLTAREYIGMKTVDDQFVPWVASQSDILACDWMVVV